MKLTNINTVDWIFKWIALVSAIFATAVIPGAKIAWSCVVLWIITSMVQKKSISDLEKDRDELMKENNTLYNKLESIRSKQ